MAATLRNILKAADGPLTTNELTVAFLQVRGLQLEGHDLTGLANKVSSCLAQDAARKLVKRHDREGTRRKLWTWVGGNVREASRLPS